MSDTQPTVVPPTPPTPPAPPQYKDPSSTQPLKAARRRPGRGFWLGLLGLLVLIILGAFGGYSQGLADRRDAKSTQVAISLKQQFDLGVHDLVVGNYDTARQHIEYVLKNDPNYPAAAQVLAEILIKMSFTPTPVPTSTPTMTPTPDLRNAQVIYAQAQQQLAAQDWDGAINTMEGLRKSNSGFQTVQVDGMYYIALRNRGVAKILGQGAYAQSPNLEGGIYDLTVAERFAPLDGVAQGYRNFARVYITGSSYWDVDWEQAVSFFKQVYVQLPNLRDGSGITATERFRLASIKAGDLMMSKGKACAAWNYYEPALALGMDSTQQLTANRAYVKCYPPTAEPAATSDTPAAPADTETPTP